MFGVDKAICDRVNAVRRSNDAVAQDARQARIRMARTGNLQLIAPDAFSEEWPAPVIANLIDTAARDIAESLAPLPTLSCNAVNMRSAEARKRAQTRQHIGTYYWHHSNLKKFAVQGADWFFTYGFLPMVVEPDLEANCPRIRFEEPFGAYPDLDRYGRVRCYVKVHRMTRRDLAAMYPELTLLLCRDKYRADISDTECEVITYRDAEQTVMYVEGEDKILLEQVNNLIGRVPVAVAQRVSLDGKMRGQYDDAIWVQIARAKMASLSLEAGMKAVEAPIAVPQDMVDMPIGPDSIWRTDSPEKIRRVGLDVPADAFRFDQRLEQEAMRSVRYPEARSGQISASVITGRGVQELMGSFDAQIKTAQDQFGVALAEATSLAFELDERAFGDIPKEIYGVSAGAPYQMTYKAKDAIKGDYSCDVTYGLAAGLAPNNAVVMMLQLLGAQLISKESVQKQLPFDIDTVEMTTAITLEQGREAIMAGVQAFAQSIPSMAQQGMDPTQALQQISTFMDLVKKGKPVEDAANQAFTPPPPPEQPVSEDPLAAMGGEPGATAGLPGMGGPEGPQALPDVLSMVGAFRNGRADMSAAVKTNQLI
jgi:hypothetical protein